MADAKLPSPYEIVIFGGSHADLPITPHAGAIIGETVALALLERNRIEEEERRDHAAGAV